MGRVDVVKHGRRVAVVLSPQVFDASSAAAVAGAQESRWGDLHMIPAELARAARMLNRPSSFDEE